MWPSNASENSTVFLLYIKKKKSIFKRETKLTNFSSERKNALTNNFELIGTKKRVSSSLNSRVKHFWKAVKAASSFNLLITNNLRILYFRTKLDNICFNNKLLYKSYKNFYYWFVAGLKIRARSEAKRILLENFGAKQKKIFFDKF